MTCGPSPRKVRAEGFKNVMADWKTGIRYDKNRNR
jgi:hypothetical protein